MSPHKLRSLPLLFCWEIWIAYNLLIFQNTLHHWSIIAAKVLSDFSLIPDDPPPSRPRNITSEVFDPLIPQAYFDGAAQEDGCSGGAILHISTNHSYSMLRGFWRGTKNNADLSVAQLILFALVKNCWALQLFGDSKNFCDWLNRTTRCWSYSLRHILDDITHFDFFTSNHIYKERNTVVDHLSKEVALWEPGIWMIYEQIDGAHY